jgi:5-methylcytosine-specific restriction protein A
MPPRPTKEWIGKTPTSMPSIHVLLRLHVAQGGKCACPDNCGIVMDFDRDEIDCDHKLALRDGGENRESNLQVMLRKHHRKKTRVENIARGVERQHKAKAFSSKRKSSWPARPKKRARASAPRLYTAIGQIRKSAQGAPIMTDASIPMTPAKPDETGVTVKPEVLLCPFCGTPLEFWTDGKGDTWMEHNDDDECILSRSVYLAIPESIAAWNRRSALSPTETPVARQLDAYDTAEAKRIVAELREVTANYDVIREAADFIEALIPPRGPFQPTRTFAPETREFIEPGDPRWRDPADPFDDDPASSPSVSREAGWQTIDSAPVACHMLLTYWSEEFAEWIVGVEMRPFDENSPWTHWMPLPTPPTPEHGERTI